MPPLWRVPPESVLDAFDSIRIGVLGERVGHIHVHDVGERHQPCEHIGKLFPEVRLLLGRRGLAGAVVVERGGQFADLFHEKEECAGGASCAVSGVIAFEDELLEVGDGPLLWQY